MLSLRSDRPGRPYVIGHRGASGEAPENTMASFELAVEQQADLVELDVHLTSDGVLVVIHDFAVDRTTDGHGLVMDLTSAEVRGLDAAARFPGGFRRQVVPTLDEVLEWARGHVAIAIELKSGPVHYPGIESRVAETVERHGMSDNTVVISFDHTILLKLKRAFPGIATGALYACAPVSPSSLAMAAHSDALLPHWGDLSRDMVEDAHMNGLAISTWAVDEERDMGWVMSMGVDAIATNYPGRLVNLMRRAESR